MIQAKEDGQLPELFDSLAESDAFSIVLQDEPEKTRYWFRATDICSLLFSRSNAHKYVTLHCKDWQYREFQSGKGRPALYVCESGVYRLILRSKAPVAIEFQDWLTEEVLPKLRADGGYIMPAATQQQLEALTQQIEGMRRQIGAATRKAELYVDLSGATVREFCGNVKRLMGGKFRAKIDHFASSVVDELIDAGAEGWRIDVGFGKLSDYYYALDALIAAGRRYVQRYEAASLRKYDEHFAESLEVAGGSVLDEVF